MSTGDGVFGVFVLLKRPIGGSRSLQSHLAHGEIAHDFFRPPTNRLNFDLTIHALHAVATQVTGSAQDLHGFRSAEFERLRGGEFGLADFGDRHRPFSGQIADLVEIGLNHVDPRGHVGDLVADHLMPDEFFSKGLSVLGPADGLVEADLHHAEHPGDHAEALIIEIVHDREKALIFRAHQMAGRNPAILEIEGGLIGGPPAHFTGQGRARKTRRVGIHEKEGNALQPPRAGPGADDKIIGAHPAGNEGLAAIEDIAVPVAAGGRLHPGNIRPP